MQREEIWQVEPGEERRPGIIHIVITALLIGIGAVVGAFGSFTLPLGFGVNFFWPAIAVQNIGGIWYGAWGIIAAALFPIISNGIAGTPVYVSLAYIPGNAFQSFAPAWAFRRFKADPRLKSARDWLVFLISITIGNIFGALWGPLVVLKGFGLLTAESVPLFIWGWFAGNEIAGIIFGVILLKALSGVVINTTSFVKKWWA